MSFGLIFQCRNLHHTQMPTLSSRQWIKVFLKTYFTEFLEVDFQRLYVVLKSESIHRPQYVLSIDGLSFLLKYQNMWL